MGKLLRLLGKTNFAINIIYRKIRHIERVREIVKKRQGSMVTIVIMFESFETFKIILAQHLDFLLIVMKPVVHTDVAIPYKATASVAN